MLIRSGLLLYWSNSGGLQGAWLRSGPGVGFTLGSVAAIIVYGIGFCVIRPRAERLGAVSKGIAVTGGPPTAAQQAELQKLGGEMAKYERVDVALLMVLLVLMATARYWTF